MTKEELRAFVDQKINKFAQQIVDKSDKVDEYAVGEISFYMVARRIIDGTSTLSDKGMVDAINDVLVKFGKLEKTNEFLNLLDF